MAWYDFITGTTGEIKQAERFRPEQLASLQSILGFGQQQLQNPYSGFEPIKQAALTNFKQDIVPYLSEQFAKSGSNLPSSGVFTQQLGQAGAGLAERLAALQSSYGQEQQKTGLEALRTGLTPSYENLYLPGQEGLVSQVIPALANVASAYLTGGVSGLPELFKGLFGGSGMQTPGSTSGTQNPSENPLMALLKNLSPLQLVNLPFGSTIPGLGFGSQPRTSAQVKGSLQQGGISPIWDIMREANLARLPQMAKQADLRAALALPRPGFEL